MTPELYFLVNLTLFSSPLCHSYWFCPFHVSAARVPTSSATKCYRNGFFSEMCTRRAACKVQLRTLSKPVVSDKCFLSCQAGFVMRGELFFKVKMFTWLKLHIGLFSVFLASHLLLPIMLSLCSYLYICLYLRMLLLPGSLLPFMFLCGISHCSPFDSCSVKRKLLPIMPAAEESMTMTPDSNVI